MHDPSSEYVSPYVLTTLLNSGGISTFSPKVSVPRSIFATNAEKDIEIGLAVVLRHFSKKE